MSFAKDYGVSDLATAAAQAKSKTSPFYMTPVHSLPQAGIAEGSGVAGSGTGTGLPSGGGGSNAGGPEGSINIPGPDYTSLIEADPNYLAWLNSSQRNLGDAATQRKAAIRALVQQYGGLPEGITDTYGDLTAADIQAGKDNPYSQMAQLQRSYDQNTLAMKRSLAARGALHSGDLGYEQNQLDTQKGQAASDLGNQFSNSLAAAIGSYLGVVGQENDNRDTAVGQAYQDVIQNPLYRQGAGGQANLVSDWQSKYGKPVYQDSVGNLYTVGANGIPSPYFGS